VWPLVDKIFKSNYIPDFCFAFGVVPDLFYIGRNFAKHRFNVFAPGTALVANGIDFAYLLHFSFFQLTQVVLQLGRDLFGLLYFLDFKSDLGKFRQHRI
jgi:hypothetical protein